MEHTQTNSYISFFIISLLLLTPAVVTAQNTPSDTRTEHVDLHAEVRSNAHPTSDSRTESNADRRTTFEARAAEIRAQSATNTDVRTIRSERMRAQVSARLEARLRTVVANIHDRMVRHIKRLSSIADRIEERANILEERGLEVGATVTLVANARIELRNASIVVTEDLPAEVAAALEAESPRDAFGYVKESIRTAAEHVREAHHLLREAVAELKAAVRIEADNESGTVGNTDRSTSPEDVSDTSGSNE